MAINNEEVTIHGTLQADEQIARDAQATTTRTLTYKGDYSALESDAQNLAPGVACPEDDRYVVKSWSLRRVNADQGLLSLTCGLAEGTQEEGGASERKPLKEVWSVHSARNDMNVLAYCGPSPGANPQRAHLEMWLKESDANLADVYKFRNADGSEATLSAPSQALAKKMARGVESVIRFYVVVTRKTVYSAPPKNCLENLGYIDTPPTPGGTGANVTKHPETLNSKLTLFSFLKVQDDIDEEPNGNWTRTESWMGGKKDEMNGNTGWDGDLYGANRWAMPAMLSHLVGT